MTPEQLKQLLAGAGPAALSSDLDVLDERELEVFSILTQGYSPAQIDSQFGIAPAELTKLKKSIQKKLKLRNEIALLQFAIKRRKS